MKKSYFLSLFGFASVVLLWTHFTRGAEASVLPRPQDLPQALYLEWQSGYLIKSLFSSVQHWAAGLAVGIATGFLWGTANALLPKLAAAQQLVAAAIRPIPPIAWIPFAIAWFGITTASAAFIVAVGVFWTVSVATESAIQAVDVRYLELARAFGHDSLFAKCRLIIFPAASPGVFAGVRTAIGQGWTLVVAAELFGVPGIGQRMWEAAGVLSLDVVVVYMGIIALTFSATEFAFRSFEKRYFRWRNV